MALFVTDPKGWRALLRRVASATRADDAEDLLHAAFVKLQEYRDRATITNPAAYLVRTAVNLAHDEHRGPAAREGRLRTDPIGLVDDMPLQDEVFAARARLVRVQRALGELSPRTRQVFLMHRLERMKYREIADQLGITVSAVEKHIAKAALFLAERMKDD
ncbi:MAG TPA: sigma-70 family RNA polymerase sigma factor [Caulobacteraceae bacterium]|jgi:RNA polymerase sigma-70 factor (ECF subfamily)